MADPNINPLFDLSAVVTDVGLAAASVATPTGPWINIRKFKIADGYGFKASRTDQELTGNILYEAPVSAYRNVPPKIINVMCTIPAIEGPWQFGELGLYVQDPNDPTKDVLFAHLVFPSLQLKTSSLVTNVASTYTFNCLIDLEQSTAIFQINNGELQTIWVVNKWSDVYPQNTMANPAIEAIVVQEPDPYGRSTVLVPMKPDTGGLGTTWAPQGTYRLTGGGVHVAAVTASYVEVPVAELAGWYITGRSPNTFVLQFAQSGLFRCVASVAQVAGARYRFTFTPDPLVTLPPIGSEILFWEEDSRQNSRMTQNTIGEGRPGRGIQMSPSLPAVFEAFGLLHGAPGTGRALTSADNLNSAFDSGIYHCYGASLPVNYPPLTVGGHVYIANVGGLITQVVWPQKLSVVDPIMPQWRFFDSGVGGGTWGPWSTLGGGSAEWGPILGLGAGVPAPDNGIVTVTCDAQNPKSGVYMYVNGTQVARQATPVKNISLVSSHTFPINKGEAWTYSGAINSIGGRFRAFK